jgi:hypothetical protein
LRLLQHLGELSILVSYEIEVMNVER